MSAEVAAAVRAASRRRRLRTAATLAVPVVLATFAVLDPGAPVRQVDLNDGAVWLTNAAELKLGRYNAQVGELNAGLVADASGFDVLQDADDVLLVEPGRVSVVDPAAVALGAVADVPAGAVVSMAAGTVAVTAGGSLWTATTADLAALATVASAPDLELGERGGAVVTVGGTVVAVEAAGTVHRGTVGAGGYTDVVDGALAGAAGAGYDAVTAVGDVPVGLDGSTLSTPEAAVDLGAHGEDLVLQAPGPASDVVLVATPTALLEVPLGGGAVRELTSGGSGRPAAPVRVGACALAAWATATGSYLEHCDGDDPRVTDLVGMTADDRPVFRVNRDVVVLNDTLRGRLWVPTEDPELREPNWQDIEPDRETEEGDDAAESTSTQTLQAECTAESAPPTAVDDEFGVRPGRTTVLAVIDNDTSSDCGILAISELDPLPAEFGTLAPVHGGRALQLTASPGASGTADFTYTVTDGRGSSAPSTATVRLTVRDEGVNEAPVQVTTGQLVVEQGASAGYDVLADFRDPDGDPLLLASATAPAGTTVRTRQGGELVVQAPSAELGRVVVQVVVTDGTAAVEGTLLVDVRPAGSVVPVIDPVHAQTYVGQPVTVSPLASVRSASREPVRLAGVDQLTGAEIVTDLDAGTFTFRAAQAGTYYVSFLVAASPQQATGVARIDVRPVPDVAPAPTAVLDVALLPPGGEVTVDPLANDVSPSGAVLVLQSVDTGSTGVEAAVIGHRYVRLTSPRVLDAPVTLRYTMHDGTSAATGDLVVQPVPATAGDQAPVVPDVTATVRTGGVVTIAALEHAYDPDGDVLTLEPDLAEPPAEGLLFVSGDVLRFQAPATPGEVRALFAVSDPSANRTTASVTVVVHASDAATKAPPRPRELTARVFEGETIRIPVPLTGIDDDGDGVLLLGADTAPGKGIVRDVGADYLEYEALPGEAGTDTFTYAVEDWVGQRAVATVRVGIVPRPAVSAQVVARNDDVTVRPGQVVSVRVLANDTDTGGGDLELADTLEAPAGVSASRDGRRVVVQAPPTPGVVQVVYTAVNARGGRDSAVLTVTVAADARILPPVARDVVVAAEDTLNAVQVEVDVLEVAENPSGPMGDLAVSVPASADDVATVTARGTVLVTLVDQPQTLPYQLTNTHPDAGGAHSFAFITVPALGDFPPVLRPGAEDLRVLAGEQLVISLQEHVQVAPGRTARVTDVASVTATRSDGSSLVRDPATLLYTAQRTYAGPAAITFRVSDGPASDPTARTRTLTLPITVLAAEDYPPRFAPSVLEVGPGETTSVDLTAFTSAPVGTATGTDRYTYRLTSDQPPGFLVQLDGTELVVTAATTAVRGTVGGIGLTIAYGAAGLLPVEVDFRVVASSRQLARVFDQRVLTGVRGEATTVAVLENASNPFPSTPLQVVGAVMETPGGGTVTVQGDQVVVRPGAQVLGEVVARFRVRDATGDPDREVEGRVTVVVRGRPDTPTAPRVVEARDRTVQLAWDAPAANGEPITGYRVTSAPGGTVTECPGTTCTIANLTNDTQYTFTVEARNAVGWSAPSVPSAPARPDAVPEAPGTPRLTFGDRELRVAWDAPVSPGSPVQGYTVEVSPATASGQTSFAASSTSLVVGGLTNGVAYQVRVRALNRAPEPGPWSPWAQAVPARAPDAPAVTAARSDTPLGREIRVAWAVGNDGGDAVIDHELVILADGAAVRTLGGLTTTSYVFSDAANGVEYSFEVRARNKAGTGPAGRATASTYGLPGAPTLSQVVAPRGSGSLEVSWTEASGNGTPVTGYVVALSDGRETQVAAGERSVVLAGLTGGTPYSVRVRASNVAGLGEWSESRSATVTTPPAGVTGLALSDAAVDGERQPTSVTATWDAVGAWGGGGDARYEYRFVVDGVADDWAATTATSATRGGLPRLNLLDRFMTVRVDVRAVTAAGESPVSTVERTYARVTEPGPVSGLVLEGADPGATEVTARWSQPADLGGSTTVTYEYRVDGAGPWLATPWTTAVVPVPSSTEPVTVSISVRAVNAYGEAGDEVTASVVVDPAPPPEPPAGGG